MALNQGPSGRHPTKEELTEFRDFLGQLEYAFAEGKAWEAESTLELIRTRIWRIRIQRGSRAG